MNTTSSMICPSCSVTSLFINRKFAHANQIPLESLSEPIQLSVIDGRRLRSVVNFRFDSISPNLMACPLSGVQFSRHNPRNYVERESYWVCRTFLKHHWSFHLMQLISSDCRC
uniref:Uncharacterized protein n=1 Tax=Spongospora subterranea TaxID=70186 RepID=A0A0H5QQD5_9EUKA|eukprot:CRZ03686.1 hypothetical protein [Spongospora subterranea]